MLPADVALTDADQRALQRDCWREEHQPFSLDLVDAGEDLVFPHAWVRTSSAEWDGCGGRTDLQETFGLLWAILLRTRGVASAAFADWGGFGDPTEIYSRNLLFFQPFNRFYPQSDPAMSVRLAANTAAIAHDLTDALWLAPFDEVPPEWDEDGVKWRDVARLAIGNTGPDAFSVERLNPNWRYYSSPEEGVCVLELMPMSMAKLRFAARDFAPKTFRVGNSLVMSADGMHHAISMPVLRRAERILQAVEGKLFLTFDPATGRWDDPAIMVIPLENCLVLIGLDFLVAVQTLCGYRPYLQARRRWEQKNRAAADIFGLSGVIEWCDKICSERFADMVHALLKVEPGVSRVRAAGPHNERDQGRDLLVERATVTIAGDKARPATERVVVQVKTRQKTVGKKEVIDIRDTIAFHNSRAYLLVAYPQISNDLMRHLEVLEQHGVSVDWWTRSELEDRLRRHPQIASQFPDLLVHRPPV